MKIVLSQRVVLTNMRVQFCTKFDDRNIPKIMSLVKDSGVIRQLLTPPITR